MSGIRITTLVENTATSGGLLAEHGLAFWIEVGRLRVLWDTGSGNVLLHNAKKLGVRLTTVDRLVLSHGHYDHTGGLGDLLKLAPGVKLFAHPAAFAPKYARNPDGKSRSIGIRSVETAVIAQSAQIVSTLGPTEIGDGLFVTGEVPRTTDFEDTGGPFFLDPECQTPDELLDDQSAFFDTPDGTWVILGCAHAGIINTLRYIHELTDHRPIHTVVGGTHLLSADANRMDRTVEALRELDIKRLFPAHCSGFAASARLWSEFPGRVAVCPAGTVLESE